MKRFFAYLKALSRNMLFQKTVIHFTAFFAAIAIFTFLTANNYITEAPQRVVPPEYQVLAFKQKTMPAIDLEGALSAKSKDVQGLIFFTGTQSIVVLGDGFEKDKIVLQADLDIMRNLATTAKVPVVEKPSALEDSATKRLPSWWPVAIGAFIVWFCWLMFVRRERKEEHSRFRVLCTGIPNAVNGLIALTGMGKRKAYTVALLSLVVVNVGLFAGKLYHDHNLFVMPADMATVERTQTWQAERLMEQHPEDFRRISFVRELNSVYLAINTATPQTKPTDSAMSRLAAEDEAETVMRDATQAQVRAIAAGEKPEALPTKPYLLERTVIFPNTVEGKKAFDSFIATAAAKKIDSKAKDPVRETGYIESLTNTGRTIMMVLLALTVIVGGTMMVMWGDWKNDDTPRQSTTLAFAGGGSGGSGTGTIETRDEDKKTFADVAGCDEAIQELKVVMKKIRRPKLYKVFGAPVPAGIIFYGPPGTGKTLLARALAGEIDSPIEILSGSQFVEMYVGVGAKRVREAYAKMRAAARRTGRIAIIFIDEFDAIAKKRGGGGESGGDKEYEQTINELLVQMNGFGNHGLVITIAATNRLDVLDEAVLRPGRFDIKVKVPKPDRKGRAQIFGVYLKKLNLILPEGTGDQPEEIEAARTKLIEDLARRSNDFSGADIEGAVKNAATIAVERKYGDVTEDITDAQMDEYRKLAIITVEDLHEGIDKMAYGTQIKSRVRTDAERWATALHECGHGAVPTVEGIDPVNRITIVMTDKSLGLMDSSPQEGERYDWTDVQFLSRLRTMLAGRAAEKLILKKVSTGASNDFERASLLARQMVGVYGMSKEFGVKSLPLDQYGFPISKVGEILLDRFNMAWGGIVDKMEEETDALIRKHRKQIIACAEALYDEETLTGDEFRRIWNENAPKQGEVPTDESVRADEANIPPPPVRS